MHAYFFDILEITITRGGTLMIVYLTVHARYIKKEARFLIVFFFFVLTIVLELFARNFFNIFSVFVILLHIIYRSINSVPYKNKKMIIFISTSN